MNPDLPNEMELELGKNLKENGAFLRLIPPRRRRVFLDLFSPEGHEGRLL